ncbi:hypothetical protein KP509_06G084000 [Ceratopteris richardii]|nr:hypothetical protein KP509_06G084000 [Ceratopteris richardii]
MYRDVEMYLSSLERINESDFVRIQRCEEETSVTFSLPPEETIEDNFMGSRVWWTYHCQQNQDSSQHSFFWDHRGRREYNKESRSFSLKMLRADKERIIKPYLQHIICASKELERSNTQRKLCTNDKYEWDEVELNHPSTFDSIALSPDLKELIVRDLDEFKCGETYYHSVGRAWKRGYLLYGPPGTGKSSLIAAIANHLNYDIYDLELTSVADNTQLKSLLTRTRRKSIIVIEDIDCSLDLSNRSKNEEGSPNADGNVNMGVGEHKNSRVTLSGLLNFTDGLWSCCGEERIFIFTTNHKERLDPALLRSGRMDLHILLSYCTFPAFKVLAANYLGVHEHALYPTVEKAMQHSKVTPAEVVELLLTNKSCVQVALERVMAALDEASRSRKNYTQVGIFSASDVDSYTDVVSAVKFNLSDIKVPASSELEHADGKSAVVANGHGNTNRFEVSNGDAPNTYCRMKKPKKLRRLLMKLGRS